ncbi:MAG TPA: phytanoyl-CoA dioxygenase family protein, partial [Candidatus Binataceae bacterium]|nr:phytanoyl-CoA dioxygenase family protein [Candidatus Binataceae bacterium]
MELEVDGLTVVPPEVHGFPMHRFDEMVQWLLARAEAMIGCRFTLDQGPLAPLEFPSDAVAISEGGGPPNQFLIQQLARYHRVFRDLAVNRVAVALMRHLIGERATRFSSHNSFMKWHGEYGYGPGLGLHADQTAVPLPWGRNALTANTNWCLTDYTLEGGALAFVPASHRSGHRPVQPEATRRAVPVEAPKGSLIVFHGATWHGAFPRKIPGMRISIANYYRHAMITSQEDIQGSFPRELADDCDDPAQFKTLAGFA